MTPWIAAIQYRGASPMAAREVLIRRLLHGVPERLLLQRAGEFARDSIPQWVRPEALESLREHRRRGSELLLISNSARVYLEPWARRLGFSAVFGTEFEVDARGRLSGYLIGTHCQGEEKLACLKRHLGRLDDYEVHVYGDSDGDVELLAAADFAYYQSFAELHRNDQRGALNNFSGRQPC
jgi:HAD superfamily hydrolase (TIGR01490 family)